MTYVDMYRVPLYTIVSVNGIPTMLGHSSDARYDRGSTLRLKRVLSGGAP